MSPGINGASSIHSRGDREGISLDKRSIAPDLLSLPIVDQTEIRVNKAL
jgi:hypothetical protein